MKRILTSLAMVFLSAMAIFVEAQSDHILWYDRPAEYFEESLVLGNGRTGATVFGGIQCDKIHLNEATLWTGEPVDPHMNPDAHTLIPLIRDALENEDYRLADSLQRGVQGSFSQSYAPVGTLLLEMHHGNRAVNYQRELDISKAIAKTSYEVDGCKYEREYFVSHPEQLMLIRLSASRKDELAFDIRFESLLPHGMTAGPDMLEVYGYAPWHAEPSYRGEMENAVRFDPERGTRFNGLIRVSTGDGYLVQTDSTLGIRGASEAVLLVSLATSFNGFHKDPATEGLDPRALAGKQLERAGKRSFQEMRERHVEDYQGFFSRVRLELGESMAPDLPTDERLKRYSQGAEDKKLEILYFQFGRYLLISSSRTPEVPANLQGIWNPYMRPPWSSNYTMNINLEENYWLAENTNLSEMHAPLLGFIGNLSKTGEITARTFFGADGWTACHNSDIWAMSNPVGDFGQGHPVWANWYMAGAWLSTHLWEHYAFGRDREYLESYGYPIMKGAAEFCLDWLVEDRQGSLITSPSTSPENIYLTPDGYRGATLYGATSDLAMIRELFIQTMRASEELGVDNAFRSDLQSALERLYPYQVGRNGNLQEWYHDWEDADPEHRHQSHLFGLYPGHHISPGSTPKLADACRTSLEIKGDESTGWSKGWRINLWARLLDGNRAYKMYRELLHYVVPDGLRTSYSGGGGTYPNLLDAHPPFQIDGNFGGAAAVAEMLLQSSENVIHILPALPDAWPEGSVSGLRARGGFELDLEWKEGRAEKITIRSGKGGKTRLRWADTIREITLEAGESRTILSSF